MEPSAWTAQHPAALVSQYFIMGLDQHSITGRDFSWWQQNHPDWILYACSASGSATHDVAYMSGINVPDVPIDIHNPAAVAYQVQTMAQHAKAAGYNALAIDQVVFWNIYHGGNPNFHQRVANGEYGCGSWHGGTFEREYASAGDAQYARDVVQYVRQARSIAHQYGLTLIVNHPAGSLADADEQELVQNTDVVMDETGFSDYGNYTASAGGVFRNELAYAQYAQQHGTGMMIVDKFTNEAHVDSRGLEYAIATYLLANDGGLLLFTGGNHEYGTMQYHPEYDAPIGHACGAVGNAANVYVRRFSGGISIVNASASAATFALPAGPSYRDLMGRPVGPALPLGPNDAFVLLTGGSSC